MCFCLCCHGTQPCESQDNTENTQAFLSPRNLIYSKEPGSAGVGDAQIWIGKFNVRHSECSFTIILSNNSNILTKQARVS